MKKKTFLAIVFVFITVFTADAVTREQLPKELKTFFMNYKEYREGKISGTQAYDLVLSHINPAVLEMEERESRGGSNLINRFGFLNKEEFKNLAVFPEGLIDNSYWYDLVYYDESNKKIILTCCVSITDNSFRIEYILPEGFYLTEDTEASGVTSRPHSINPERISYDSYTSFVKSFYENYLEPYSNNEPGLQQKLETLMGKYTTEDFQKNCTHDIDPITLQYNCYPGDGDNVQAFLVAPQTVCVTFHNKVKESRFNTLIIQITIKGKGKDRCLKINKVSRLPLNEL